MSVHILGIRHHGPGSSRAVLAALEGIRPDAVLIECPADTNALLPYLVQDDMLPPVAMLVYDPKDFKKAAYLPFTAFSPEWVAVKWAMKRAITTACIDLPLELSFALNGDGDQQKIIESDPELGRIRRDPLGYMAELAGYDDRERWWETIIEQSGHHADIFGAIADMMRALREATGNERETRETLLREAYMRRCIRDHQKRGYQNIAVVCGAWHAPVLQDVAKFKDSADAASLRGLKKLKTAATWIPWSYHRMTFDSGYGAGISSPAWYETLFTEHREASARWLTRAAQLLRAENQNTSTAHIIEAVRLAETLAVMRGLAIPGLEELDEAMRSTMGSEKNAAIDTIRRKLLVGDRIGNVPPNVPSVPLQRDFEASVRSARLKDAYETTNPVLKELDLRTNSNLAASRLLHRLNLLQIGWGSSQPNPERVHGTFKEIWELQWEPDFAIRIIEASQWGNTVEEAAAGYLIHRVASVGNLTVLTALLETALKADLSTAVPSLIARLQDLSALTTDVPQLMSALPSMVATLRYGSVRRIEVGALLHTAEGVARRVCIGLPTAATNLDDDAGRDLTALLQKTHQAIMLLDSVLPEPTFATSSGQWSFTLQALADSRGIHPTVAGTSVRLLFDRRQWGIGHTATRMRYAMSRGNIASDSALWLEGFLQGNALLLVHHPHLWSILNDWVDELEPELLRQLLPILRRSFSNFSPTERQKILQMAKVGQAAFAGTTDPEFDERRAAAVLPFIRLIMGGGV